MGWGAGVPHGSDASGSWATPTELGVVGMGLTSLVTGPPHEFICKLFRKPKLDAVHAPPELFVPHCPTPDTCSSGDGAPQYGHGASFSTRACLQLVQNIFSAYLNIS